ncbi:unnamed protein product [Effrenium voratum]|uniref:PX domain-containing protein n=1 Tax=Effrenium voratum TaxID=2562239 RepID=A0AA36HW90_9DINO|nr:unnamed protein product [Effrenium voratum]
MSSEAAQYHVKFIGNTSAEGHTTYVIKVTNSDGASWNVQKRYRELRELHDELKLRYPENLPQFPAKRFFGNNDPAFITSRQAALEQYLLGVLALEPEVKTLVLRQFLGGPPLSAEQTPSKQYTEVLESMEQKLVNFSLPPAPLDEPETAMRVKKYGESMKLSVLAQPVDPVILRDLGLDNEVASLANSEQLDALKAPAAGSAEKGELFKQTLAEIHKVMRPEVALADESKLIARFPDLASGEGAKGEKQ